MLLLPLSVAFAADPDVPELNAQLFHMSVDGRVGFGLDDATVYADRTPQAKVALHYVNDPLVYVYEGGDRVELLSDLLAVDVMGGWTFGRFRVGLDLPLYVAASGDLTGGGVAMGDAALDGKAVVIDPADAPVGLAVVGRLLLPTGSATVPVGAPGAGGELGLVASKDLGDWRLAANLGTRQLPRTALENLDWGSQLTFRAGAARAIGDRAGASVELAGASVYDSFLVEPGSTPVEAMLGGWYEVQPAVVARLGVGSGLTDGIGAPAARVVASVAFEPGADPDKDDDGIVDKVDACREVPEDADEWEDTDGCPDPDDDQDGIADASDGCRRQAEDLDAWEDADGCPDLDDDKDGLADAVDACKREAEDRDDWKDEDGCPDPLTEVRLHFVDEAGRPVPGVRASVGALAGGTDVVGELGQGRHTVHAEAPGFQAFDGAIDVPNGPPLDLTRTLKAEPNTGTLEVRVTNTDGKPLDVVFRLDDGTAAPLGGGFTALPVKPGSHTVHVTAEGHASTTVPTSVSKGRTTTVAIVLQPARVVVKKEELQILDKIYFDTNKTTIRKQSFGLLDEIANVLKEHPEIVRVSVEGHTDSRGNDASNLKLSDGRAKAVVAYLVKKGVAKERLAGTGFGEGKPVDATENEAAWEKNRRVEFRIVERAEAK